MDNAARFWSVWRTSFERMRQLNRRRGDSRIAEHEPGLLPVATLVFWSVCVTIGVGGFALRSAPEALRDAPPIEAELLKVETVAARPPADASPPAAVAPAAPAEPLQTPEVPPVVAPSAPAFAEPVPAPPPPRVRRPRTIAATRAAVATQPAVIQLTYGQGEGEQPAPEYPAEAVIGGEEGTVVVRFTVDRDGRVSDTKAVSPCRWPILNSAAVRAIRDSWRFRAGAARVYEVSIEFHLNKHEEP
jgi:TonB family protein